jgi:hypothetical protein
MLPRTFLVALCLVPLAAARAVGPPAAEEIDLGGPRRVKASVGTSPGEYVIKVRLLPVHVFDPATNARLNREKGREFALLALARHLEGEKAEAITVTGARVTETGTDGKYFTLTVRVPRSGVALAGEAKSPPGGGNAERVAFSSALFTRKREYLLTLRQLAASVEGDLRATARAAGKKDCPGKAMSEAVAALEKQARANLRKLAAEVRADLLLLTLEQEEVLRALEREQARLTGQFREALRPLKKKKPKEDQP